MQRLLESSFNADMGPVIDLDITKLGTIDTLRHIGVPDELAQRWGWWGSMTLTHSRVVKRGILQIHSFVHTIRCADDERFVELESLDGKEWLVVAQHWSGCSIGTRFSYG